MAREVKQVPNDKGKACPALEVSGSGFEYVCPASREVIFSGDHYDLTDPNYNERASARLVAANDAIRKHRQRKCSQSA